MARSARGREPGAGGLALKYQPDGWTYEKLNGKPVRARADRPPEIWQDGAWVPVEVGAEYDK